MTNVNDVVRALEGKFVADLGHIKVYDFPKLNERAFITERNGIYEVEMDLRYKTAQYEEP